MNRYPRRRFLKIAGTSILAASWPRLAHSAIPRVVVVGGGAAGTIAAKQVLMSRSDISVTLVERHAQYFSSLAGSRLLSEIKMESQSDFDYEVIGRQGIDVIHDSVSDIDPAKRLVSLAGGDSLTYDRLILAPGVDLKTNTMEGYDDAAAAQMPHAWSNREQSLVLKRQLDSMRPGGSVAITVPEGPISSPTAPYQRASHMAHYLKRSNPTAKILICDAKNEFPMSELFLTAWDDLYPGMIDWIGGQDTGGGVNGVDSSAMKIFFPTFSLTADVVNIIPPQTAGSLAEIAGVCDESGWCPVQLTTFESVVQEGIHIIGDATLDNGLPKRAQIANSQAKTCAQAIVSALTSVDTAPVRFIDIDYCIVGPDYGFSSITIYRPNEAGNSVEQVSSAQSSISDPRSQRSRDFAFAVSWHNNISAEMFG